MEEEKEHKKQKIIKIIAIVYLVLIVGIVLFGVFMLSGIGVIVFGIKEAIDMNTIYYETDYDTKRTEEEVYSYIIDNLKREDDEEFKIVTSSKQNIEKCKTGWDNYRCDKILDDAYTYTLVVKSSKNIYFTVLYQDAYYEITKKPYYKEYHEIIYVDNYDFMNGINQDEKLKERLDFSKGFINSKKLEVVDKYYVSDIRIDGTIKETYLVLRIKTDISEEELEHLKDDFHKYYVDNYEAPAARRYNSIDYFEHNNEVYRLDYDVVLEEGID